MKTIILYTRSGRTSPSSNYRLLQYSKHLAGNIKERPLSTEYLYKHHANASTGAQKLIWYALYYFVIQINITRYMLSDIWFKPDCIIVQRALSPKFVLPWNKVLMKKGYANCSRLIWDFDDQIFNNGEITNFEKKILCTMTDSVVVTSDYLKSLLPYDVQKRTILMSTTDGEYAYESLNDILSIRKCSYKEQIELLWLATSPSLPHLYKIIDELDSTAACLEELFNKKLILHVVCNKPLVYDAKFLQIDNIVWTREAAKEMILRSHMGIMPLTNTISSKGKGGFKIVQYMSVGMPSVATRFGYNIEIIKDGETGYLVDDEINIEGWREAIFTLSNNWGKYSDFSSASKKLWDEKFSYQSHLEQWQKLIDEQ